MYENYAKIMDSLNLTDYQVAKDIGIPRSTFSEWKKKKYAPKTEKLKKIAAYLNVSVDYLETGKDKPKESEEGKTYYFNDETAEKAQALFENKELRILFDAARDSKPEDLQMAAELLERLKGTNNG